MTFVTYTPFGKNRMMTVGLNKVNMFILNKISDYLIKLQITFIPLCSPKSPINYTIRYCGVFGSHNGGYDLVEVYYVPKECTASISKVKK